MNATAPMAAGRAERPPAGFQPEDLRVLLATPGIGPGVVQRLEAAGIASMARLAELGADAAVAAVCGRLGTAAWGNRRRALERALRQATAGLQRTG